MNIEAFLDPLTCVLGWAYIVGGYSRLPWRPASLRWFIILWVEVVQVLYSIPMKEVLFWPCWYSALI